MNTRGDAQAAESENPHVAQPYGMVQTFTERNLRLAVCFVLLLNRMQDQPHHTQDNRQNAIKNQNLRPAAERGYEHAGAEERAKRQAARETR